MNIKITFKSKQGKGKTTALKICAEALEALGYKTEKNHDKHELKVSGEVQP